MVHVVTERVQLFLIVQGVGVYMWLNSFPPLWSCGSVVMGVACCTGRCWPNTTSEGCFCFKCDKIEF